MDLPILPIWSQAKVSGDQVSGNKLRTILCAQPVGSALTAWYSYQASVEWGTPSGHWGVG